MRPDSPGGHDRFQGLAGRGVIGVLAGRSGSGGTPMVPFQPSSTTPGSESKDSVVGIRMMLDEDKPGGLTFDDALTAAECFTEDGIDFISTVRGSIESDVTLAKAIPSIGTPLAPFLDFTREVKRGLRIPVMHAARIADVATARHAVREGLLDLVGMTRAQIADPYLVTRGPHPALCRS